MIKRLLLSVLMLICISSSAFSLVTSVSCQFRDNSCNEGEQVFFYANDNFNDSAGNVLSANVATTNYINEYNKVLCCSSPYGSIEGTPTPYSGTETCGEGVDLFYFTHEYNSRIGFESKSYDVEDYTGTFTPAFYDNKLCVDIPEGFGSFDIVVSDIDYGSLGYSCMFKVSSLVNSVVSDCEATFNGGDKYQYSVWGRMYESLDSLQCNSDCTSKLDNRVYSMCSQKVNACSRVPIICDGALLGSWVDGGSLYPDKEFQCSAPWTVTRDKIFTAEKLQVSVSAEAGGCENLISKKFTVLLDNEQVTMNIYVCEG